MNNTYEIHCFLICSTDSEQVVGSRFSQQLGFLCHAYVRFCVVRSNKFLSSSEFFLRTISNEDRNFFRYMIQPTIYNINWMDCTMLKKMRPMPDSKIQIFRLLFPTLELFLAPNHESSPITIIILAIHPSPIKIFLLLRMLSSTKRAENRPFWDPFPLQQSIQFIL